MKNLKRAFLLLFNISILVSCSSDNSNNNDSDVLNPLETYEELNISYGSDSHQVFDLYLPANRTSETKTIVLVHGGGWTSGDKVDMNPFKDYINDQMSSYAVVNMNYRLADENNQPYPMQINDITSVINYLDTNENYYTISNEIGFVGVSAGAHLSLLWSYSFDTNSQVNMVSSIVGPTNFTDPAYLENIDNPFLQDILETIGINPTTEYLENVSPYHKVTASAPPTLLFYGGVDPLVPITQGTLLRDKLTALNVTNEFTLYPNEGHGWDGLSLIDTTLKLKAFIETHL